MKKVLLLTSLALIFTMGCKKKQAEQNTTNAKEELQEIAPQSFYKKMEAPSFDFIVQTKNGESTIINVKTEGLANEYTESIPMEGQVVDSYMADLNDDGLREFYIIVSPTDERESLEILGFAVHNDETMSMISINALDDLMDIDTDNVYIEEGKLYRTFKVNGIEKKYHYELVSEEAGYILNPFAVE